MDRAGVTVKEAWVKAKVVCRKKAAQIVLSPLRPSPPPRPPFSHMIGVLIKVLPVEIGAVLANKVSMFLAN